MLWHTGHKKKNENIKDGIEIRGKNYVSGFVTAFIIAIMNPSTVLSFLVAFSTFGLIDGYNFLEGIQIVLGILLGTGIWWGMLSLFVDKGRGKITDTIYKKMNLVLGVILIGFALVMILRCFC